MGCDIHALVERRQTHGSHMPDDLRYEWLNAGDPDLGRDYEMFAALADVRNYDGVAPVVEPRGLPGFVERSEHGWLRWTHKGEGAPSAIYQELYERWFADAHSAGWVTLAEVKAYDTTQVIYDRSVAVGWSADGAVTMKARGGLGAEGRPAIGGRRIFTWPGDAEDRPTSWDRLTRFMEGVRAMHDCTDEEVRLVFFFDN